MASFTSSDAAGSSTTRASSASSTRLTAAQQALNTYKLKDPTKGAASQSTDPLSATATPTPDLTYRPHPIAVVVRFKATGNAPIMKQNFFKISASNRFQTVIAFLRKELGWKASDALFLYINSSFSPAPDDTVANLFKCFATDGHLIVNYSSTAAWG
ncbi:BQ5605_C008g05062 [Microbotryum silenes-dioicae]|uniref:Ubiquitin-like protein ATG12 n=1 Tax=Microbotryum silenes-dioicae TaxID=796604 RepID=A0A2X0MFE7_9BASI|nr:BQ5605_C008g05062 [Microbotryum silenes-dioicae]